MLYKPYDIKKLHTKIIRLLYKICMKKFLCNLRRPFYSALNPTEE